MVVGEAFCGAGRSSGEVRRARFRVMDGALEARGAGVGRGVLRREIKSGAWLDAGW